MEYILTYKTFALKRSYKLRLAGLSDVERLYNIADDMETVFYTTLFNKNTVEASVEAYALYEVDANGNWLEVPDYGEVVFDGEPDGGEDGSTGGDKGFIPIPTLINNSLNTIWFKPENDMIIDGKKYSTWGAYPLKPGEKWYHPIDGFNTAGSVIKINARNLYLPITVYGIEVYGGVLFGKEVNGSWLNEQMFDKNWEWNEVPGKNGGWENDTKWHNIFYPNNQWHNSYY